jgi:hypothetical protein
MTDGPDIESFSTTFPFDLKFTPGVSAQFTITFTTPVLPDSVLEDSNSGQWDMMLGVGYFTGPIGSPEQHTYADATLTVKDVPEPSTFTIMVSGAVCLLGYSWCRRRRPGRLARAT